MNNSQKLVEAVKAGDRDTIESLLSSDPNLILAKTERGESIILLAIYYGQKEIAQLLLSKATELTIFEAAAVGREEAVRKAVQENPNLLHEFSTDGWTPLHLAAFFGHENIVSYLIEQGAKPDVAAKNDMAVMPLHSALATQKIAAAEILIRHGADVNVKQSTGWTPLHYAAAIGNTGIITLLLESGADKLAKNSSNQSPADVAQEKGHFVAVDMLKG